MAQQLMNRAWQRGTSRLAVVAGRTARVLVRAAYRRREGYVTCTDLCGSAAPADRATLITVREGGADDLQLLAGLVSKSRLETFRRRLKADQILIIAEVNGEPAGYCWLALTTTRGLETDCLIPVAQGEAYGYDALTFPQYRGRGVYQAMLARSRETARRRGISRIYGSVGKHNLPSRAALRKCQARPLFAAGSIRVFGLKWHWKRPLRKDETL